MSWRKWPPWQTRIKKQAETERIKLEGERHETILASINAVTRELHAEHQRQATNDTQRKSREKWSAWGLQITAAAAVCGLIVSVYQISLSRKALMLDQRAWIQFRPEREQKIEVTTNSAVIFKMLTKNIGKTVARRLSGAVVVERLNIGESPHFENRTATASEVLAGAFFPGEIGPDVHVRWIRGDPATKTVSVVIPTAEDVSDWKAGKFYFAVYGIMSYSDVFGGRHWTKFCMPFMDHPLPQEQVAIPMKRCVEQHNDVGEKDDPEPNKNWTGERSTIPDH